MMRNEDLIKAGGGPLWHHLLEQADGRFASTTKRTIKLFACIYANENI